MPIQVTFLGLSGLQLWDAHTPTLIPVAFQHQPLSTPDGGNSRTGEEGLPGEQQSPGFSKVVETIFSDWSRENNWDNTGERRPPSLLKIGLLAISSPVLPLSQHLFCLDQEDKVFFYPLLIENGGCMEYGTHFQYVISKSWNCTEFVESDIEIRSPDS